MTTWKLDNAHTQINFSAKHMMVTTVRGTFHDVEGTDRARRDRPDAVARRVPGRAPPASTRTSAPVTTTCARPTSSTPSASRPSLRARPAVEPAGNDRYRSPAT